MKDKYAVAFSDILLILFIDNIDCKSVYKFLRDLWKTMYIDKSSEG